MRGLILALMLACGGALAQYAPVMVNTSTLAMTYATTTGAVSLSSASIGSAGGLTNMQTGVTLSGNGAGWTNLNASALSSGTIPAGILGTSTVRTVGGLITTGSVSATSFLISTNWRCVIVPTNVLSFQYLSGTNWTEKGAFTP